MPSRSMDSAAASTTVDFRGASQDEVSELFFRGVSVEAISRAFVSESSSTSSCSFFPEATAALKSETLSVGIANEWFCPCAYTGGCSRRRRFRSCVHSCRMRWYPEPKAAERRSQRGFLLWNESFSKICFSYSICVRKMQAEILGCLHKFLGAPKRNTLDIKATRLRKNLIKYSNHDG